MKSKVYYWCPFIDKVATVRSVINSSYSLAKYNKFFEPVILDACGEWNNYKNEIIQNGVSIENLTKLNILPPNINKRGFFYSRFLYLLILFKTFLPLFNFIKKNKNDYIIIHLITSLPLFLNWILRKKSKIILRISGLPKLTYLRKILWMLSIKKMDIVFCPTENTKIYLENIFPSYKQKFKVLRDPIINVNKIQKLKYENSDKIEKEYFVSIGRFTKQKNYIFLLKFLKHYFINKKLNYFFFIIGEGEEENNLKEYIKKNKLENFVKLLKYKKNIFPLLKNAKGLISTALWEDPGFTLIESGYLNIPVISSDCPNGPKEILEDGDNGYIFKTNDLESFNLTFNQFLNDNLLEIEKKKKKLKKLTKKFKIFNHYKILQKSLNETK